MDTEGQKVTYFLELTEDEALLLEQAVEHRLDALASAWGITVIEDKFIAILLKLQALTQ